MSVTGKKDTAVRTQSYLERNNKSILIVLGAIILLVGGYFGYKYLVKVPENEKAVEAIAQAQQYFAADSMQLALNGDGKNAGFLKVISKYGSTPSGNLAKLYVGEAYLSLGDFNNAVKHLKDFDANGSEQTQAMVYGMLGDAYSELQKNEEAVENYKKASTTFEKNPALSSEYLYRAASLYDLMGKSKEAIELFTRLKEKYPNTERGFVADKYLGKLGAQ
ncbi:MAG: tetratricopeptide repeat protein [Chitinophagaceae bacterium]|nr:tetratricopeptide repeat protein [Chitinophagaceae bacterium]MCW5927666.1 tetratricopeptide repeat protein [Chitinophagaceae bacterium]